MNDWRQISPTYWMSTRFDVWREWGIWRAGFYLAKRPYPIDFPTAEAAMAYVDRMPTD